MNKKKIRDLLKKYEEKVNLLQKNEERVNRIKLHYLQEQLLSRTDLSERARSYKQARIDQLSEQIANGEVSKSKKLKHHEEVLNLYQSWMTSPP